MHYDIPSPHRINELKRLITDSQSEQDKSNEDDLDRPMNEEEFTAIVEHSLKNL